MPTVMITGANRGLGFEFAKQYAAGGWRVFAASAIQHPPIASGSWRSAREAWSRLSPWT
jgi:NAD(P)-dependent dehydrogenase (short-subunit alcohol dehydrogenase family)